MVYANDIFGNIGTAHTTNFTVTLSIEEKKRPFPTALLVGISVAVVSITDGLSVYFKKHQHKIADCLSYFYSL